MQKLSVKIPFAGFYESSHSALLDSWLEYEHEVLERDYNVTAAQLEKLRDLFHGDILWQAVHVEYAKAYCTEIEKLIAAKTRGKFTVNIEFEILTRSAYYANTTDGIYGLIPIEQLEAIREFILTNAGCSWLAFINSRCASRDGFVSFFSSNYSEWKEDLNDWEEARLGLLLEFFIIHIIKDESIGDIDDVLGGYSLMADYDSNGHISNWIWENASADFKEYVDNLREGK
ncbi:MAG: hypothetical protein EBR82_58275 [Caulobacteraceae bacterium]|nr:hypothetical protein [Caulobacteraceae bacterium]